MLPSQAQEEGAKEGETEGHERMRGRKREVSATEVRSTKGRAESFASDFRTKGKNEDQTISLKSLDHEKSSGSSASSSKLSSSS
jgi:hypothetical protein